MNDWMIYLLVGLMLIQAVALIYLRGQLENIERSGKQMVDALHKEIAALLCANTGLGDRFRLLERHVRGLDERQEQLEWSETSGQAIKHAVDLVKKGANADDLVTSCGLSRGEAELVMLIQQVERAG
ncbi:MAG: hypothetical protein A2V90_07835 [Gammaproteobacteria bacterium RBG_16_57_12]|nr:MAG: hypothetical protein A2V90_07835 [Gammaproteobacteria bacterium RBG_16_57_12]